MGSSANDDFSVLIMSHKTEQSFKTSIASQADGAFSITWFAYFCAAHFSSVMWHMWMLICRTEGSLI